ncbi:MAG: 2Fe-2S iron-sulfur cluster-binding protein [Bacteroidetes bacterium]|nr:2Fe-2S iron-sulfur cluster-binding protein [Bacteroidota bacterium]
MPKFTINNTEVEFVQGQTIIEAAKKAGIKIPHFCWHPGLSISGNCRICLVEIEKLPKLAIACSTQASEGMVVHTKSEKVIAAQNAVMEFLLINHPLDCPICDEAGECKLQDYAFKYGKGISRFDEEKNHKDKRILLGPNVMFDRERCISCSRCIRFCDEVAKDPQLTFIQRGEKVTITTFPGKELDNPYSMNVIDICPVGALTSKHFRFRSRVWDMSFTDGICIGCSRGCNTIIGVRKNEILRLEPRLNEKVNQWWMCDEGRLGTFKFVNDENTRVKTPFVRPEEAEESDENLVATDWEEAVSKSVSVLNGARKHILFIASPYSTLEDNYALKKFAKEVFGTDEIFYIPDIDTKFADDLLRKADRTPNATGLEAMGITPIGEKTIKELKSGNFKAVYVINDNPERTGLTKADFSGVQSFVFHLNTLNGFASEYADVVFSESTYAEINGTFMNFEGRIQRIRPAVATLEQERLLGEYSMSRLDKFGAPNDRWMKEVRFNTRPTWKILKQIAKAFGTDFKFDNSEEVFAELCKNEFGLDGMSYEEVGSKGIQIKK